ncbi:MAG: hypothetical protein ACLPSW_16240 [Roseiarcus sp.]
MKLPGFAAHRPVASTASGVWRRVAAKSLGDLALVGVGMAMAVGSIVFATDMLSQGNHEPRVNGMQYLAIFAQPRGSPQPAPAASPAVAAANSRGADSAVDTAPTGSIVRGADDAVDMAPTGSIARGAAGGPPPAESYRLVAAEPGVAWLSNGSETRMVKPGQIVPGLGRVASIVKRDGRWALVDEKGATLAMDDRPRPKGPGDRGEPFSRRMIFGQGD